MSTVRCPNCGSHSVNVDPDLALIDRFNTLVTIGLWVVLSGYSVIYRRIRSIHHTYTCNNCGGH